MFHCSEQLYLHLGLAEKSTRISRGIDFIRKYHWPNCVAPSMTSLAVAFNETLQGRFSLNSVEDFGHRMYMLGLSTGAIP